MKKEFLHCLRVQFCPGHYEDERIQNVVDYCVKYGFNNVMLFINAEEYHVGHMTKEEAKPWVATMKKATKALKEKGISVSLNPWIEMGHLDRARPLKEGQNFTTQVDFNGLVSEMVACPLCENWQAYFLDFYKYLITELEPDTVWVEDDFRFHNHPPLEQGGCYCDLHMKRYNEKLGTNYTREEFVDRLFKKKSEARVRKAWLDVRREDILALAEKIGSCVASLGLGTKVGLMTSGHFAHSTEARDWHGVHKALAAGGPMIDRLHLPCYDEITGKRYYAEFNILPYANRAFLPKECLIYPELENGSFGSYTKEARFLRFQLESAIPLCISGMTYDIYDFVGNGVNEGLGYGEEVKAITPYLNGVLNLNLRYETLDGVILPIDEKACYKRKKIEKYYDFYPDEFGFGAYLQTVGINCKVSTKKRFKNKVVALALGAVNNFTNEQLEDLFANNKVLVEGGAVELLIERGLGRLIKAKSARRCVPERERNSFEQVEDGIIVNGRKGYRTTAFAKAGAYVDIKYSEKVTPVSRVYDYNCEEFGLGDVIAGNAFIIPYVISHPYYFEQYNDLRTHLLKEFLRKTDEKLVLTNHSGVYSYVYREKRRTVVILVNSTETDFKEIELELVNTAFKNCRRIHKKTGGKYKTEMEKRGGRYVIKTELGHLSTQTLIFEEE